ncbi:unnamed protein product [Ixodes pacificus]
MHRSKTVKTGRTTPSHAESPSRPPPQVTPCQVTVWSPHVMPLSDDGRVRTAFHVKEASQRRDTTIQRILFPARARNHNSGAYQAYSGVGWRWSHRGEELSAGALQPDSSSPEKRIHPA